MKQMVRRIWDDFLRPRLRAAGFDVQRYPPPDWTERAFDRLLDRRKRSDGDSEGAEEEDFLLYCAQHMTESHAQLFQDLFVCHQLHGKRGGYFVEFGAAGGVNLSNTCLLERRLGWNGILAEPARSWHGELRSNRSAMIDTRCVWRSSGERLPFNEAPIAEHSALDLSAGGESGGGSPPQGTSYQVTTVSLNDLLEDHAAPDEIDFLSIDTEGSELAILEAFDFSKHRFEIICVEHNFAANRRKTQELLKSKGYRRKFACLSKWDDWFIRGGS